jgi:hypothetical protein
VLTAASGVALLLDGTVEFILAPGTIAFAVAHATESHARIVGAGELIFPAVISRAVLLILAVGAVGFSITDLWFGFCVIAI